MFSCVLFLRRAARAGARPASRALLLASSSSFSSSSSSSPLLLRSSASLIHQPPSPSSSFLQQQKPQRRSVFTYPAPRKLTDIMKVPLVRKCEPWEVKEMWVKYHEDRHDALAESIPTQQFQILKDRAKASRVFLYPVFREQGYMTMISQFQDSCFLFTFLEDYRKNPTGATPWMCLTLYDEFLQDKQLGLLRGDVSYHLTREEGQYLMNALLEHYTHSDKYKTLWQFNHEPKNFSFDKYIRGVKKPPKVEKPASSIIT